MKCLYDLNFGCRYYIGDLKGGVKVASNKKKVDAYATVQKSNPAMAMIKALLPLLFILAAVLFAAYFNNRK